MIFKFVVGFTFVVASVVLGLTPDSSEDDSLFSIFASMADDLKLPENYDEDWGRNPVDPDVGKDMVEIVKTRGYTIETHTVTTPDGYILTMFNIPHGKKTSTRNPKPVLLQHGLLDSSYTWVNNYEEQSLGFILADAGFDVWFGNNRGNRYGRSHTSMNPDDDSGAFWRFTWDEMASLDAPTMINFVTSYTNTSSLGWVGHSEGTIQMFAAGTITDKSSYVKDALAKVVSLFCRFIVLDI
jgi:lysosomal acid lipase/cholesteryl ester hydrolase